MFLFVTFALDQLYFTLIDPDLPCFRGIVRQPRGKLVAPTGHAKESYECILFLSMELQPLREN